MTEKSCIREKLNFLMRADSSTNTRKKRKNNMKKLIGIKKKSDVSCPVSGVRCHVSPVKSHLLHITNANSHIPLPC